MSRPLPRFRTLFRVQGKFCFPLTSPYHGCPTFEARGDFERSAARLDNELTNIKGDRLSCAVRNYIRTICANPHVHARSERVSKALRRFALEYTYVVDEDATSTAMTAADRGVDVAFDQTRALKAGPRCP